MVYETGDGERRYSVIERPSDRAANTVRMFFRVHGAERNAPAPRGNGGPHAGGVAARGPRHYGVGPTATGDKRGLGSMRPEGRGETDVFGTSSAGPLGAAGAGAGLGAGAGMTGSG